MASEGGSSPKQTSETQFPKRPTKPQHPKPQLWTTQPPKIPSTETQPPKTPKAQTFLTPPSKTQEPWKPQPPTSTTQWPPQRAPKNIHDIIVEHFIDGILGY